jgi:hypothetical protein
MPYYGESYIYKDKNPFEHIPVRSITNTYRLPHEATVTEPNYFGWLVVSLGGCTAV